MSEIFSGIKEIKIFGLENLFSERFDKNFLALSLNKRLSLTFSFLPRLFFEFFSVIIMITLIVVLLNFNVEGKYIIFKLGIFSIAIIRILPPVVSISSKIQSLNMFEPSLNNIYNEVKNNKFIPQNKFYENKNYNKINSLELNNVNFFYDKEKIILEKVNLRLKKNNIYGVIGKSGTGKSTLADLISGIILPTSGSLIINDTPSEKFSLNDLHNNIGYVTQSNFYFDDTIKNNIIFGKKYDPIEEKETLLSVIKRSQLSELIDTLDSGIDTNIGKEELVYQAVKNKNLLLLDHYLENLRFFYWMKLLAH